VADPSPAFKAGLKPGDRILSLDGRTFSYWDEFQQAMASAASGQPRHFVVERGGEKLEFDISPQWSDQAKRYLVGVTPQETTWVRYPFPLNFGKAFSIMADQSTLAYRTIKRIIENKTSLSSLSGPVSIAYITGEVARTGLYNLLWLLAIISLQLGLFNLLPIPGLDGGQLLILVVESAVRKDLPLIVKERILQVGFGLLIVLLAVILVLDVAKFFH
jgi:regulator of sigma E protease